MTYTCNEIANCKFEQPKKTINKTNQEIAQDGRNAAKQHLIDCGILSVEEGKIGRKFILTTKINGQTIPFYVHASSKDSEIKDIKVGKPNISPSNGYTMIILDLYGDPEYYCPTTAQVDWSTQSGQRQELTREGKLSSAHHTMSYVDYKQDELTRDNVHNVINTNKLNGQLRITGWRYEKARIIERIKKLFESRELICEIIKCHQSRDILITDEFNNQVYYSVWISKHGDNPDKIFMDNFNEHNPDGKILCVFKTKPNNRRKPSDTLDSVPHNYGYVNVKAREFDLHNHELDLYRFTNNQPRLLDSLPDITSDEFADDFGDISEYYRKLHTVDVGTYIEELDESIREYESDMIKKRVYREWKSMEYYENIIRDLNATIMKRVDVQDKYVTTLRTQNQKLYKELTESTETVNKLNTEITKLQDQMVTERIVREWELIKEGEIENRNKWVDNDIKRKNKERQVEETLKRAVKEYDSLMVTEQNHKEYSEFELVRAKHDRYLATIRDIKNNKYGKIFYDRLAASGIHNIRYDSALTGVK